MEKPLAAAILTQGIVFAWQMRINQAVMDSANRIIGKHTFTLAGKELWVFHYVKAKLVLALLVRSSLF